MEKEYQELDTVWFMAGSLFRNYPYDIPTEAFSFNIFKQVCHSKTPSVPPHSPVYLPFPPMSHKLTWVDQGCHVCMYVLLYIQLCSRSACIHTQRHTYMVVHTCTHRDMCACKLIINMQCMHLSLQIGMHACIHACRYTSRHPCLPRCKGSKGLGPEFLLK
jgi:hypothetical protein